MAGARYEGNVAAVTRDLARLVSASIGPRPTNQLMEARHLESHFLRAFDLTLFGFEDESRNTL